MQARSFANSRATYFSRRAISKAKYWKSSRTLPFSKCERNSAQYKHNTSKSASISETSKIVPRRQTGLGAKRHRLVVKNIKIARIMGVLPFTDRLHLREGERILTLKGREKGKLSKKIQKRNTKTNGITHKAK